MTSEFFESVASSKFSQPSNIGEIVLPEREKTYYIAKNYLNRAFYADQPNQKWLTDVSEFKYYAGSEVKKVYLSAILDLADRRIVSFVISDRNDNQLVFDTFDQAVANEPMAHPLFHSDRGFQ